MYQIETDIPPPPGDVRHGPGRRRTKYPLAELPVGGSFAVPADNARRARHSVAKWAHRHPGWVYKTAWCADGSLRIWRVA